MPVVAGSQISVLGNTSKLLAEWAMHNGRDIIIFEFLLLNLVIDLFLSHVLQFMTVALLSFKRLGSRSSSQLSITMDLGRCCPYWLRPLSGSYLPIGVLTRNRPW